MAVKELNEIYGEVGRNLDKQMDENVLIPGETGTKTFGAFKFFSGIKKFLEGSTKKIIKGGASVEGGLSVDSLTVSGSNLFYANIGSLSFSELVDYYKSLPNSTVSFAFALITDIGISGVCYFNKISNLWGDIRFLSTRKTFMSEVKNGQWEPLSSSIDVDFVNEIKTFPVGTINPQGTLNGTLDLTKNGYYPVSATMGSNHYIEVMIGSNIISGNHLVYGLHNVTKTPIDINLIVNVLYRRT